MLTGVMGVRGGVGATALAVALAVSMSASARGRGCGPPGVGPVLLDVDGLGGGLDARLGVEDAPGVRWSGLGLAGGDLAPADLVAALPVAAGVPVLAADRADVPSLPALIQVLDVLCATPAIVDLPRRLDEVTRAAIARCRVLLLVTPASVSGVLAAHTLATALDGGPPVGLVAVGRELSPQAVEAATGLPVLAAAPDPDRMRRLAGAVAEGIGS